jgi:DNA-binding ferritin-like protein
MQGDLFNEKSTKQDLKVGFTQGFDGVVERRISLGKSPCVSMEDMVNKMKLKTYRLVFTH